jgi:hypothetical protein
VDAAATAFLASDSVEVERMTRKGLRSFDSRAAVVSLSVQAQGEGSRIDLVLRHTEPAVRPDDVLAGLRRVGGLAEAGPGLVTRLEQGPLDESEGVIGDPLSA